MIQSSTLQFLKELKKNNNKPWFDASRKKYEAAKEDLLQMVAALIKNCAKFDPTLASLAPKDCVFRINRDVRFSKDKSPYKTNMAAYFNKDGKKGLGAGYYLHIEPGQAFVAGGIWMPETAGLAAIRQEIDYSFADFKKVTGSSTFKKCFPDGMDTSNSLSRPPKGYDENNSAVEYLKLKSFVVRKKFTDKEMLSKTFVQDVAKTFAAIKPLVDFINRAVE